MEIKAAIFDIDGTLLPRGEAAPSKRTVKAIRALQAKGTKIIIATGRAWFAADAVLSELKADYYVCVNGANITNTAGKSIIEHPMSTEEMYALVDFCEDYNLPLDFIFSDGYYVYIDYDYFKKHYGPFQCSKQFLHDDENQSRHRQSMPHGASVLMPPHKADEFLEKYKHLGLRIVPFHGTHCDVLHQGIDKAAALSKLLLKLDIDWAHTAAFGDGNNDAEMLDASAFSVAMEGGEPSLKAKASVVAPPCNQDGVAQIIEQYLM